MVFWLVLAAVGVAFFRNFYYAVCLLVLGYNILKFTQMVFVLVYVNFKYAAAAKTYKKHLAENYSCAKKVTHVVIIPNYNEELSIIRETLDFFAKHTRSRNYCIALAMEKH